MAMPIIPCAAPFQDGLEVTGLVDGVNISDVFETALDLTSDATVAADVTFSGDLGVRCKPNTDLHRTYGLTE